MSMWQRLRDVFESGARKRAAVTEDTEQMPTGVLLSASGNGSVCVYNDDVTKAFSELYDRVYRGDPYLGSLGDMTRTPATRARYYRIVPDRIVERVCEVREVQE